MICERKHLAMVFIQFGQKWLKDPILAQFAAFPQTEVEEQEADDFEMDVARIDPLNSKSLANTLAKLETKSSDATIKMALQKAKAQLKGKRGLRDISGLENLEGDASIISVLLNVHLGNDATDSLKELSKSDSDLADAFTDLIQLRNGVANDWDKSRFYPVMTNYPLQESKRHGR